MDLLLNDVLHLTREEIESSTSTPQKAKMTDFPARTFPAARSFPTIRRFGSCVLPAV